MYKVFIQNTPIFFVKKFKKLSKDALVCSFNLALILKHQLINLSKTSSKIEPIFIYSSQAKEALFDFFSDYKYIEAAGGLVINDKDELLLIKRNGIWDLPKGKIEVNEHKLQAAKREIEEECGVNKLKKIKRLSSTFHTYDTYGENCLKQSFWFHFECKTDQELIPQKEEGIEEVRWVKKNALKKYLTNTYPSIKDVVEEYLRG